MKFLCALILSCLAFSSVHAESEIFLTEANTNFETLREFFNQGTLPQRDETFGWWSGRCYNVVEQNKPLPQLLVSKLITTDTENGPAFPPKSLHQMVVLTKVHKSADYFDNDLSDFGLSVNKFINAPTSRIFIAKERDGSLYVPNLSVLLRKYGNYFITQSLDGLEVYQTCYFFKKVY